jgi:predicted ATPase
MAGLSYRSWAHWLLGFPDAANTDLLQALRNARDIGQAATLIYALAATAIPLVLCGNYASAIALADELIPLADQKDALFFKAFGMMNKGSVLAMTRNSRESLETIRSGMAAWSSTGATLFLPSFLTYLARAHLELGQLDDAARCIGEALKAVETTQERWWEAEVYRVAGEITASGLQQAKAQSYFERALAVARQQQAKSWELRAAMSMARLWRDQVKRAEARDLLAPVYGWFTEGFDTLDLKEAKALLDELRA